MFFSLLGGNRLSEGFPLSGEQDIVILCLLHGLALSDINIEIVKVLIIASPTGRVFLLIGVGHRAHF